MIQFSKDNCSNRTYCKNVSPIGDKGLGNVLILLLILSSIEEGALLLTDTVTVNEVNAKEKDTTNKMIFEEGEKLTLSELLRLHVCTMSPGTSLLLAKLFREQTKRSAQNELNLFVEQNKLSPHCCKNISGRKIRNTPQSYTINDLKKIGQALSKLSKATLAYLTYAECVHQGQLIKKNAYLIGDRNVAYRIVWENNSIVLENEQVIVVLEAENPLELDRKVLHLLDGQPLEKETIKEWMETKGKQQIIKKESATVLVAGDTYLGEWYTNRRLQRNQWDPLTEKGYDYSFEKVAHFLEDADYSIINLEAVLVKDPKKSPMNRKKKFVLGARADETARTLKKHSVDLVTLATNHINDFESVGTASTLNTLTKHGISYVGSGFTEQESLMPVRVKTKTQDIFIFNGYWYRNPQYRDFGMYAIGDHLGGNCLSESLFNVMAKTKKEFPESKILVICHWGVDFQEVRPYQQVLAKRLVDAGADFILGHGPHAIQEVGTVKGKDVVYSLGNFVFNSNGEFDTHEHALPYGMVMKLLLEKQELVAEAHFIRAENQKTNWQPDQVDALDFERILAKWGIEAITAAGWGIDKDKRILTKKIW